MQCCIRAATMSTSIALPTRSTITPAATLSLSSGYVSTADYGRRYVFRDHPSIRDLRSPLRASLGSTSIIVNGQGAGLWEDRYLPFGDVRYHSDTVTNTVQTRYRYTGQWLEEGLAASPEGGLDRGLYDYGARWYDASLGRFVQPDTIVPEPGNPQALNRYAYVLNNTLRYTDPSGHAESAAGDVARWQKEWE